MEPDSRIPVGWLHGMLGVGFPSGERLTQIGIPVALWQQPPEVAVALLERAMGNVSRALDAGFVVCRRGGRKKARPITSYRWLEADPDPSDFIGGWH